MADIIKTQADLFDYETTLAAYTQGSNGAPLKLGTEIEQWIVSSESTRLRMMSSDESQKFLRTLATNSDAQCLVEDKGIKKEGKDANLPLVMVKTGGINYQLELSGVLEAATDPVPADNVFRLLRLIDKAQNTLRDTAEELELTTFPCAVLGAATVDDCEKNMVPRERLKSEWAKFSGEGRDSAGLRTMGLATSVQVSIGYRNEQELREIVTLGNYLSPLLIAAFANTTGFAENKKTPFSSRAKWWLDHNAVAPRGGIPKMVQEAMDSPATSMAKTWIDYVMDVPMVYYFDKDGAAKFDRSPTFRELQAEGNGTKTNYALAESLVWPDVKLIGGQRVELRMCDSGPWQAKALTLLAAGLLTAPETRRQLFDLIEETGITSQKLQESRQRVCVKGLNTHFGNTTLRELLPKVVDLALENCSRMNLPDYELKTLETLRNRKTSDEETLRSTFNDVARASVADKMTLTLHPSQLPFQSMLFRMR